MKTNIFLSAAALLVASVMAIPTNAQDKKADFDKTHPRRAEVNKRLDNQNARVDNKVDEGKMSKGEAKKIHKEDHAIRKEERRDAAENGGHITKAEQKHINHQENKVSKQIKNN